MAALTAGRDFLLGAGKGPFLSRDIEDYPEGIILPIDKPWRWTSADVIRKIKYAAIRHFGKKNLKVGHAGTLDPLATGVLLVCIGKATRLAETLQRSDKEYVAGITFGATTPSYDLEKEIDRLYPLDGVSREALLAALPGFLGDQEQVAPLFSAKSVDGKRAYELARSLYKQGLDLDSEAEGLLTRQRINISSLELLGYWDGPGESAFFTGRSAGEEENSASKRINFADNTSLGLPRAEVRVGCSKGTYIRALARDMGEALGSGAHLDALARTRCGSFTLEQSLSMAETAKLFS